MIFNFEFYLVLAVLLSGIVYLMDVLIFKKKRMQAAAKAMESIPEAQHAVVIPQITKPPLLIEYARSFFPILLAVLLIRSFVVEPFRIPSGSLKPTLLVGDFILVNKFDYGLRLPVLGTKVIKISEPKVGDVVVFRWPSNPSIDFIKRVVGVPGDRIQYVNKVLYVNGKEAKQQFNSYSLDRSANGHSWPVEVKTETLNHVTHGIYINPDDPNKNFDITVPKGEYFMMGDNRDASDDSRYWGFVPEKNLIGKAFMTWMSWNSQADSIRWSRIGKSITNAS